MSCGAFHSQNVSIPSLAKDSSVGLGQGTHLLLFLMHRNCQGFRESSFPLKENATFLNTFKLHIQMAQSERSVNIPLGWLLCISQHKTHAVAFEHKFRFMSQLVRKHQTCFDQNFRETELFFLVACDRAVSFVSMIRITSSIKQIGRFCMKFLSWEE